MEGKFINTFNLKSGQKISFLEDKIIIEKLVKYKVEQKLVVKKSAITSVVLLGEFLFICGIGLPTVTLHEPKVYNPNFMVGGNSGVVHDTNSYIPQSFLNYPNCISGNIIEIKELYDYILNII